jgi:hypothetical protein
LIAQPVLELTDYRMLRKLLLMPQIEKPLAAIQFLFLKSINEPIYGRLAATTLRDPLARFADLQVIVTWLTLFLRKTFIFVGVSASLNRYEGKRMRILKLFEGLQDARVDWMNKAVIRYYSSLVNSERLKHNIVGFGLERITDFKFLNEVDLALRQSVSLKFFFDNCALEGDETLAPVSARPGTGKIRSSQSKPLLVSKPAAISHRKTSSPRLAVPIPGKSPPPRGSVVRSCSLGFGKRNGT